MSITPEEIERLRGLCEAVQTGPAAGAMAAAARLAHDMSASTVLGLLDEVERLQGICYRTGYNDLARSRDRLKRENERLRLIADRAIESTTRDARDGR